MFGYYKRFLWNKSGKGKIRKKERKKEKKKKTREETNSFHKKKTAAVWMKVE